MNFQPCLVRPCPVRPCPVSGSLDPIGFDVVFEFMASADAGKLDTLCIELQNRYADFFFVEKQSEFLPGSNGACEWFKKTLQAYEPEVQIALLQHLQLDLDTIWNAFKTPYAMLHILDVIDPESSYQKAGPLLSMAVARIGFAASGPRLIDFAFGFLDQYSKGELSHAHLRGMRGEYSGIAAQILMGAPTTLRSAVQDLGFLYIQNRIKNINDQQEYYELLYSYEALAADAIRLAVPQVPLLLLMR